MKYKKIINLLYNASNQPSKFRTKNSVKINDLSNETYNTGAQIKFKTTMLKSSFRDYSDTYMLIKGNITVNNTLAADADASNSNRKVIFKNCAPFTECISEINNTQADNAKYIDIVIPMYNLIEYSDIIQKHLEAYGNTAKMYMVILLILMELMLQIHLILEKK